MIDSVRAGCLLAVLAMGCNAIVDTEADQCQSTSDCRSKGGAFASSVCSPAKVCVPLLNQHCTSVKPDGIAIDDDTLVVGFMAPLVGEFASNGIPQWEGIQVALDDLQSVNFLPAADGTSRRKLAVIGCHDLDDHLGVARHLAEDVGVPAILGPAFSGITLDVATEVTVPKNTLLISSSATSPAITNLPDKGLVWRTCPADSVQAIPLAYLVEEMEANIRTQQSLLDTTPIKVAIAVKGDAYGKGLADAIVGQLKFNFGKTVAQNDKNFLRRDYDDPSENPDFDFAPVISSILSFTPNIIMPLGTNEGITKIIQPIESSWQAGSPRPIYIVPDGGRLDELLAISGQNGLRDRVIGTVPGFTGAQAYQDFASRFTGYWNHVPGTYADTAYDSLYVLSFAAAAASAGPLTGPNLAKGLEKTVGGTSSFPAGANDLNNAFSVLLTGAAIDYQGASGPLEFDVATGEAPADIDIWCITSGGAYVSSGQRYDAAQEGVVGSRTACPSLLQ